MDRYPKFFRIILPIYWAFLTFMLLKPGTENQEYWFMFKGIDKLLHFTIFFILGCCILLAFPKIKFFYYIYTCLIYAFCTEILQDALHWGRSGEILDIVADALGVCISFYIWRKLFCTICG